MANNKVAPAHTNLSKEIRLLWKPVQFISPPCSSHGFLTSTLELSNLDMLYDYYNSVLLFYDVHQLHSSRLMEQAVVPASHDEPVTRLIRALEELLVHYPSAAGLLVHNEADGRLEVRYPLPPSSAPAGHGQMAVSEILQPLARSGTKDSNAATPHAPMFGVQFHVAHANIALSELGDVSDPQPCMDVLYPIMVHPNQVRGSNGISSPVRCIMAFQVTTFKCGGFTVGHTCSHLYFDGFSAAIFLKNFCSIARGEGLANPPDFSISRRVTLSPRDPPSLTIPYPRIGTRTCSDQPPPGPLKHLHYGTAQRFVFPTDALEALRSHASKPEESKPCSRTQALMALLWSAFARVKLDVHGLPSSEEMALQVPMNLRTRGIPKLSANYVGNAVYVGNASATLEELCERPLSHIVDKLTSVTTSLDLVEAYQSAIDDLELKLRDGLVPFIQGGYNGIRIPSLVNLPFYETDCGWGSPVYVSRPSQQLSNRCIVLGHPAARAWNVLAVFASEEERACFEKSIADYIIITNK